MRHSLEDKGRHDTEVNAIGGASSSQPGSVRVVMCLRSMIFLAFIAPKILKPSRRQFSIFDRVLDVPVSQEELNGPRILFVVGQLKAAAMPQLMGVHREAQGPNLRRMRNHLTDARICQWSLPFREKDVRCVGGGAALQPAQGANLGRG